MGEVTIKGHIEIMQVLLFDFVDLLLKLRVFIVLLHNVDVLIKWLRENVLRETHVFLLFNTAIVFIILIRLLNLINKDYSFKSVIVKEPLCAPIGFIIKKKKILISTNFRDKYEKPM